MSYQFSWVAQFCYNTNACNFHCVRWWSSIDAWWLTRCRWISVISIINSSWHHKMNFKRKLGNPSGSIDFHLPRCYSRLQIIQCLENTSFRQTNIEWTFSSPQCLTQAAWLHLQFKPYAFVCISNADSAIIIIAWHFSFYETSLKCDK